MERLTFCTHKDNVNLFIKEKEAFGWKHIDTSYQKNKAYISFSRDTLDCNYKQFLALEAKFEQNNRYLPFWPLAVFCFLAFALMTALLVTCLVRDKSISIVPFICGFGIPSFFFLLLVGIYNFLRVKSIKNYFGPLKKNRDIILNKALMLRGDKNEE